MRARLSPFVATLVFLAAACGGGGLYGGSATPARPATVAQPAGRPDDSGAASTSEATQASAPSPTKPAPEPTTEPPPTASPAMVATPAPAPTEAAPATGPVSLTVVARDIRFAQTELTVDAGAQVTLTFDNQDSLSHNIDIVDVAKTDIFGGPGQRTITFTAPEPGTYAYRCDVHPGAMRGTLIVR